MFLLRPQTSLHTAWPSAMFVNPVSIEISSLNIGCPRGTRLQSDSQTAQFRRHNLAKADTLSSQECRLRPTSRECTKCQLQSADCCSLASNPNSLHFIKCDLIVRVIVEFGRARGFVGGDGLGVLQGAAVQQEGCDAGCAEGVEMFAGRPAARARRLMMRSASVRWSRRGVIRPVRRAVVRKRGVFLSALIPAAMR